MTLQKKCSLLVLGATGSIGLSTLDIVRQYPDRFLVHSLTANRNIEQLWQQCLEFSPRQVVIVDDVAAQEFKLRWQNEKPDGLINLQILSGEQALVEVAQSEDNDCVMAAIVGAAGLAPTLAAANIGKRILLANKESLVMAGSLFMKAIKTSGAELLPIDSEHNAIFQCLPIHSQQPKVDQDALKTIKRIILTASGGPFLEREIESFATITPDQACQHPKWKMGRKISVDSATLMNKGLEVIEACLLFDLPPEQVEVIIHPQSIVHSMVEYIDASVIAELANPDMKIPIAYGLAWPERIASGVDFLDLVKEQTLSFTAPDLQKFPCLALAYGALKQGPCAIAALNAANEIAVESFLEKYLAFNEIPHVIEHVLALVQETTLENLADVTEVDNRARRLATKYIADISV